MIWQVRTSGDTTETTQVKELLKSVDLEDAVVTAEAVHTCREPAGRIAGAGTVENARRTTSCSSQCAAFNAVQRGGPRESDHAELDYGH